jgi:8-oxo-dGTP pyrophosphatase MutT (NUDIX family)
MNRRIIVSTLIKCKDKYLFIKQEKAGGAYQDCLHLVGGSLEENETLEEAIKREVMEEVHIKLDKVIPFDFDSDILMYKGAMTQLIFLRYTTEIEEFTGYADSDAKEIVWLKKEDLLKYKHNEPSLRFLKKLKLI